VTTLGDTYIYKVLEKIDDFINENYEVEDSGITLISAPDQLSRDYTLEDGTKITVTVETAEGED
jgi:hypothetical protein